MTTKDQLREELMQALHSAQFLVRHLRSAHSKAIEDSDQYGDIAIMDALEDATALCARMERLSNAAGLHRDQVTGIEAATATKTTAKATATPTP